MKAFLPACFVAFHFAACCDLFHSPSTGWLARAEKLNPVPSEAREALERAVCRSGSAGGTETGQLSFFLLEKDVEIADYGCFYRALILEGSLIRDLCKGTCAI